MTPTTIGKPNLRTAAIVTVLAALLAACSSNSTSSGIESSTTTAGSTTTVAAPPETTAPATTTPPTTVPAPIVFTMRGDGLGPFDFGVAAAEVVDALTTAFGASSSDENVEYPDGDGFGGYQTVDGEMGFESQFGRTVCFGFEFCAQFGANDASNLRFTGWTYGEDSGLTLASTSGVTIGSLWSDFPAMVIDPGGCYSVGYGMIDGIDLTVQSSGVAFGSFDDLGNYIEAVPPANQVSVVFMQAGANPAFLFGDC